MKNIYWQPTASIEILKIRARILAEIRAFFSARDVWEVETPLLSHAAVTDPNIESFSVNTAERITGYLHTSPEFAMKRLLAAGSGSIYQICKVFRQGELGRKHNPEFSLLEWYRIGMGYRDLMAEVDALVHSILGNKVLTARSQSFTYRAAFIQFAHIDPFIAETTELINALEQHGITDVVGMDTDDRNAWLDLTMTHVVEPKLPMDCVVFIYDYPASQAALSRVRDDEFPVAERFELYINGMELANGFHELVDVAEQQARFVADLEVRRRRQQTEVSVDQHFLTALEHGMPACSGVALGLDRLLMLAAGVNSISEVLSFNFDNA